jgi:hypothetical protein
MSAARTEVILGLYQTPTALQAAFRQQADDTARELMLRDVACGMQQRKLGPALSKLIFRLFYWPQY